MKLLSGGSWRSTASLKRYLAYSADNVSNGCDFCIYAADSPEHLVTEGEGYMILKNLFGYDLWDDCGVIEHLMIVPKRHIASLAELTAEESVEYMQTIARYSGDGYSLYARQPGSIKGSMPHQHTHLIKIDEKRKKWIFYIRRPHVRWMR